MSENHKNKLPQTGEEGNKATLLVNLGIFLIALTSIIATYIFKFKK